MQLTAHKSKEKSTMKNYVKLLNTLYSHIDKNGCKDLSKIKEILQLHDINYKMSNSGNTALHFIVEKDWWFTSSHAEFFISQGSDPTIVNHKGQTVIHWFISQRKNYHDHHGDPQALNVDQTRWISFLLTIVHIKNKNTTNFTDCHKFSHFHAACMTNSMEIVEFFLENGVSVDEAVSMNSPKYSGYTSLHFAALYGYDELFNKLLSHGASLLKDAQGMTVLHMLVERNMKIIQYVNLHRVAIEEFSEQELGCYEMDDKETLLAEIEINEKMITSILLKTDKWIIEKIDLLPFYVMRQLDDVTLNDINKHLDVNSTFWPGYSPLHFAARFNVEAVKSLIKKGANIEAKDAKGITPFELCVGRYSIEDIHCMISNHSDWRNIVLSDGKTALLDLIFAMQNPEDFVKFFAEKDNNNISIPSDSALWPGFSILHLVVTLSKKGMRLRLAHYVPFFQDDFIMEEPYRSKVVMYSEFNEDELIRRPEELLGACLRLGGDVTAQDLDGSTPIHLAFRRLDLESMYFMIKRCKGDSNPTDKDNLSLLHIACAVEDVNLVKKLIASGADINAAVLPSFQWDPEVLYFYKLSSDKHLHVWPGSSPLHVAMSMENREIIKLLMEANVDLDMQDANGCTALHLEIAQSSVNDAFDDALLCKLISEDRVVDGLSYLHIAALQKYSKFVEKLLNLGVDVNAVIVARERTSEDKLSQRHYMGAVSCRTTKLSYFFSYFEGNTPLHMALERCFESRHYDIAKTLVLHGADVLAKNSRGICPLSIFLTDSQYPLKHYLLTMSDSEEKRLAREMKGMTKLHLACRLCDETLIRDCLKKSTNVNARVHNDSIIWPGFTPLHVAADMYSPYITEEHMTLKKYKKQICAAVRLLLNAGADVMIVNAQGQTPLLLHIFENYILSRPRHINIMWKKLKKSSTNPMSDKGISHFHLACIRNDVAMVKKFLKLGVDANQTVDYFSGKYPGYTPLHFAVSRRVSLKFHDSAALKTINLLLKYGANVNAMDVDNNTPLHLAGEFLSLGYLPYKRMFWAGADTEIETLSLGAKPISRLFNVANREVPKFLRYDYLWSRRYYYRYYLGHTCQESTEL